MKGSIHTATPAERSLTLAGRLAAVGAEFVEAAELLRPIAAELAALEAEHRAAINQARVSCSRQPARGLAADVVLAALQPLRPYLPFVSSESAALAAERLTSPCACLKSQSEGMEP